jgi:hypothetical protein
MLSICILLVMITVSGIGILRKWFIELLIGTLCIGKMSNLLRFRLFLLIKIKKNPKRSLKK